MAFQGHSMGFEGLFNSFPRAFHGILGALEGHSGGSSSVSLGAF